jgi:hypothetical protein
MNAKAGLNNMETPPNDNLFNVKAPVIFADSCAGRGKNSGSSSYREGVFVEQAGLCSNPISGSPLTKISSHATHDDASD